MPNIIHVLSEETINQIAAGEVIENPASVVKELVENSVDANATRVIVEIEGGGLQKICVSDNGKGMSQQDLLLSLERHATSKIRIADDLNSIFSMGFRGEALASIAAISKLTVISCEKEEAHKLYAEKGKIQSLEVASRHRGTTVQISSLFYNVPTRRKFQKSLRSRQNDILKILTKMGLAYPFLELKCIADQKEIFSSFMKRLAKREEMLEQVSEKILGENFLKGTSNVYFQNKGCILTGLIGAPHQTRKNRGGQYLFVNSRIVDSPEICRAIYEGYGTSLPSNEHPTFVLHLTLPTEWIDVNVHPQKKEIRLREANEIQEVIRSGICQAFQTRSQAFVTSYQGDKRDTGKGKNEYRESPKWEEDFKPSFQFREEEDVNPPQLLTKELPIIGLYSHYLILDSSQLDLSISGPQGIVMVDLQGAEARITFEALLKRFEKGGEMQTLLFPLTFECTDDEKRAIYLYLETLKKLGIAIRPFGEKAFIVDAIDPHLKEEKLEKLIHELIHTLEKFEDYKHLEKENQKKLALRTLRFARSQKKGYTIEQAKEIVNKLFEMKIPYQGPTGKPTCIYLSQGEIEQSFR